MAQFLIGTSGYDYPEWKGVFYPEEVKRVDFLSYYATVFNALELNFSFYGMPTAERMEGFYARTEGKVFFSVKANRLLTHEVDGNWKNYAEDFKKAVTPLQEKGVLSGILFQFPESFRYSRDNRFYLGDLLKEFCGFPVVVEFRHKEWIKESVFDGLEKLNCSLCFCDMPQLKNLPDMNIGELADVVERAESIKKTSVFVGPNAYIRLHGRNAGAWYAVNEGADGQKNGSARYDYDYSNEELSKFVPVINDAYNKGKKVHVYFNNHPNGNGAKNAKALKEMVELSNLLNI
ncbi:MAG: DUF72 domain-containing protein [Treponema sp.]|nr:DUF72 domain-containing protein [Treponema sp.]